MTKMRIGGFVNEARRVRDAMRTARSFEEYTMEDLESRENEHGYAGWCKDGISGDYQGNTFHRTALPKTNAEIDAEVNECLTKLGIEGVEVCRED